MGLQDLTPQLRTRLNRAERVVGLFVTTATVLMIAGFAFYLYHTAVRKGWFLAKVTYATSIQNAAGLKAGDPIKMMGFQVGEITRITPNEPGAYYNITVFFRVTDPNFGYLWTDSRVRVTADFLGGRALELIKGTNGIPTVRTDPLRHAVSLLDRESYLGEFKKAREMSTTDEAALILVKQQVERDPEHFYLSAEKRKKDYWLDPLDAPALNERLEQVMNMVEAALPNILALTNQIAGTLEKAGDAAVNASFVLTEIRPAVSNLNLIAGAIQTGPGGLGEWLIPTNLNSQLDVTLQQARLTLVQASATLAGAETNLTQIATQIDVTLANLASITGNLNAQVQSNPNVLASISSLIRNTDEMVQGLKHHWLLRSAFRTNAPPVAGMPPVDLRPPRQR